VDLFALGPTKLSIGVPPIIFWCVFGVAFLCLLFLVKKRKEIEPGLFWILVTAIGIGMVVAAGLGMLPEPQFGFLEDIGIKEQGY
jgi:hypothetical protein